MLAFAGQGAPPSSSQEIILLAQAKASTLSKDEAINKATKIQRGNVLKATPAKRHNQVVGGGRIEDPNHATTPLQINPQTGDAVKSIGRVDEDKSFHFDNAALSVGSSLVNSRLHEARAYCTGLSRVRIVWRRV